MIFNVLWLLRNVEFYFGVRFFILLYKVWFCIDKVKWDFNLVSDVFVCYVWLVVLCLV